MLPNQPASRLHRAAGKDHPVLRPVGQLDPFLVACENNRMIARDRSAAQRGKADRTPDPRSGDPVPPTLAIGGQFDTASPRRCLAQS